MANKLIQAVAGAGKTYTITHNLQSEKRYLFLSFTRENVKNLRRNLADNKDDSIQVSAATFSTFVINWLFFPFLSSIEPRLVDFKGNFTTEEATNDSRKAAYYTIQEARHYLNSSGLAYLNRLSKLINRQNSKYLKKAFKRLSRFVDVLVIDEFQDLLGEDFKLVCKLMKQNQVEVIIVGDIFQTDVTKSNFKEKNSPLSDIKSEEALRDFIAKKMGRRVLVDTNSLKRSRRISESVANFVTSHLHVAIESNKDHDGDVHIIKELDSLYSLMEKQHHVLGYRRPDELFGNQIYNTWQYTKGDEFSDVVVILSQKAEDYLKNDSVKLRGSTRNKLYVAMTRTLSDLYIVPFSVWKQAKLRINPH
ncbi:hypothetical protein LOSG293_320020 [Secundilactobacillus oryzae JCM 18671]|uniref:DNA helicase n=1 Tax=Secundilactobacillus oryzae JCM 18671 TaxID=1291743 RepID=A0A081BKA1_9LACO|nr:AAA family ATPase [Secundilactobacillus oryzae]GAK48469.1 hypothetical protein LOSG293_320020 [Secundilactobacillus oryzae JCM 18671]